MWQGNLRSHRLQQDSPRALCSVHPRQQGVPEDVSTLIPPIAHHSETISGSGETCDNRIKSTNRDVVTDMPCPQIHGSFNNVALQYAVLDIHALYLAEASCDDHVSSLSLFVQDLNSSDTNRGHGEDITACFTVGNRAPMHRSTTLSCYKYLLMLY